MCALFPPFQGSSLDQLYKSVQIGIIKPLPSSYSAELSDFIQSCLRPKAKDRPSVEQILNKNGILMTKCYYYEIEMN